MLTNAQSQSMPLTSRWQRSARNVCASPLACHREAVGALRHPVADRQVALLLADVEQCVGGLDQPSGNSAVISGSCVR